MNIRGIKLTKLTKATEARDDDFIPIVQDGETKVIKKAYIVPDLSDIYSKEEINKVLSNAFKLTSGVKFTINQSDFIATRNINLYKATLNHNLNLELEGFSINFYDLEKNIIIVDYKVLDNNSIEISSDVPIDLIITIKQSIEAQPGRPGDTGPPGKDGKDGKDGINGKDGKDGPPGVNGIDGIDGKPGVPGPTGEKGRDGVDGSPGRDGIDGKPGKDGKDGVDGKPGLPGVDGVDGKEWAILFQTLEERDSYTGETFAGFCCYVVSEKRQYFMLEDGTWHSTTPNSVHFGVDEPSDKNMVWVDSTDESPETTLKSEIVEEFIKAIQTISAKADKAIYAIDYELDPGTFTKRLPGTPEGEEIPRPEGAPNLGDGASGTCNHILVKRGLKSELTESNLMQGEFGFCIDTEELYVGNKGAMRLLAKVGGTSSGSGSSNNLTGEYLELVSRNKKKYRVSVNESGKLDILPTEAYTADDAKPSDSGIYKGLVINMIYGGGAKNSNIPPVSHGFIEIYNNTDTEFNLKGLSIQYAAYSEPWQVLPLRGMIKPRSSFLIRGAQHTDINRMSTRLRIFDYDMHWEIPFASAGMKVYLKVGTTTTEYTNPANTDGAWTPEVGYIDLIGVGGENVTRIIDGYEKAYLHCANTSTGVHRIDFADSGDNSKDCEPIDFNKVDIKMYAPRCQASGQWNIYYNKCKMDPYVPVVINICFGKNGTTERTFTWQTTPTRYGYLMYRKDGEINYTKIMSNKQLIQHQDTDVTSHSVILTNLNPGRYYYKVGEEGKWSDEYHFDVKAPTKEDKIEFIHVTDQQGWTEEEYTAWEKSYDYIQNNDTYDFIINSGDISQNANRRFFSKVSINGNIYLKTL